MREHHTAGLSTEIQSMTCFFEDPIQQLFRDSEEAACGISIRVLETLVESQRGAIQFLGKW